MAYSFARSERNFRDVSAEKNEETLDVSQGKEIPDYLDLEFAWLNDYDNKGNYRPREHRDTSAENISKGDVLRRIRMTPRKNEISERRRTLSDDLSHTVENNTIGSTQNPYGWIALGPTKKISSLSSDVSRFEQNSKSKLRETVQSIYTGKTQKDNPYGWNALGPTRKKPSRASRRETSELRQTGKNDLRDTFKYGISSEREIENPYGWNALGPTRKKPSRASRREASELRQTGKTDLRDTFQYGISSEKQTENPYGWNALGPTRKKPSRASRREASELRQTGKNDLRDTFQYGISSETQTENPYGWNALGPTRKKPSRASRQKANELRQTGKNDLRQTGKNDLRDTFQYGTTSETQTENPYGWNALGPTRKKPSRVSRNKASELRQTGKNNLRDALHNSNATEFKKENPYGRKASGPTRRVHYITTVADVHAEAQGDNQLGETYTGNFAETTKENPYGWKALGRTRPPPEMSVTTDKDIRATRKRTYREFFAKSRKNMSGNYKADNSSSGIRKIIHAKRLPAGLEESARRKKNKASDQSNELRTTQGGRDLHVTGNEKRDIGTTVNDLRGTAQGVQALSLTESRSLRKGTYDYAYTRYIKSDTVQDPVIMIQEDIDKPERKPTKNLQLQRPLPTPSTQWRNIATDQHLMEKWHELFAKIKKKWSVTYNDPSFLSGASGDTSFIRSEYAERREKKRKKEKRFRRVLICVAVAVVLLVAIIIPVVIFTRPNDDRIS